MTESAELFRLPPPRCLVDFVVRSTEDPGVELDKLVEVWPERFFRLACPCGGEAFRVRGRVQREKYLQIDRLAGTGTTICRVCGRAAVAFDPALHGYDVEIDHFPGAGPCPGVLQDFSCPACARQAFALVVRFQYPDNVLAHRWPPERRQPLPQDLFTYFSLLGRCVACGEWTTVQSTECA
ncbi:MAG: hypothetical protein ABIV06_07240 [Thermoanaerobaculia bacterium]